MILLLTLLALLTESPQKQSTPQQAAPTFRVAGIIVDATSALPIPHAEVSLSAEDSEDEVVFSGEDGRFVFTSIAAGRYPLAAYAHRYIHESFNQHGTLSTAILVGPGLDTEHIIFRLHRQAVITGRIYDEHGEAVRSAQVFLFGSHGVREKLMFAGAPPNELGEYRFAAVPAGKYAIAVSAHPWYQRSQLRYASPQDAQQQSTIYAGNSVRRSGASSNPPTDPALDMVYPTTFYPGVTDEHAASEIAVVPGDTVQADVQLQAVPSVHVRVRHVSGDDPSPAFNVSQMLFDSLSLPVSVAFAEVAPGEFEVSGLPPGSFSLRIVSGNESESNSSIPLVNLLDGQSLDLSSTSSFASLSGRVTFPRGEGVPARTYVFLFNEQLQDISIPVEKDGSFSMPSVPLGSYKIAVNMNVPLSTFVDVTSAAGAATDGRTVTLSSAGDAQLNIRVSHGVAQLSGFARLNNQPCPGVMVLLVPASGRNLDDDVRIDQSDSDGSFSFLRVRPGNYFVLAIDNAWDLNYDNAPDLAPYLPKAVPIQLAAGDRKDQSIDTQLYTPRPAPSPKP
jgi:hypothetical protein